jgi:mono/diheme cytochrome c family protein
MRVMMAALLAATFLGSVAVAQTPVERGRYLVESIVACGNCHTPQGPNGPIMNRALSGGPPIMEPGAFTAMPSNITPDPETGIGKWTDAELKLAIREGKRPAHSPNAGSIIGPPMPFEQYRMLADADLDAIVAYLRTVPAISNKVPKSTYNVPLPPAYGPPITQAVAAPPRSDKVAYGAYLAGPLGHCIECHTPMDQATHRFKYDTLLGAGGFPFHGPWGISVSRNITSHAEDGLGKWSDAEIERAIRTGVGKDGRKLMPPMAYGYYAKISADDMSALIAYLRSIAPKKTQ